MADGVAGQVQGKVGNGKGKAKAIARPPLVVRMIDPMARWLVGRGLMGPNVLLTVRGRKSGEPRTAAVALAEIDGRRWVFGAYGEVNWVRNLRAAGEATIRVHGRDELVRAVELSAAERIAFVRDTLAPWLGRSLVRSWASRLFIGDAAGDPVGTAERHPVFELRGGGV